MDDKLFDSLIRALHRGTGSRRALPAFLAGLSLPLIPTPDADAGPRPGKRKRKTKRQRDRKKARKEKAVDSGVRFLESLAATMKGVTGDCAALAQAAENFRQQHLAELNSLANQAQQVDVETRSRVAKEHQARITQAAESLNTLLAACRFRGAPEAAICGAPGVPDGAPAALPGAAQCTGCDCSCICPIDGWTCAANFFGCAGGSHASCCWFAACAEHMCAEQCPNCCNCNFNCCGC